MERVGFLSSLRDMTCREVGRPLQEDGRAGGDMTCEYDTSADLNSRLSQMKVEEVNCHEAPKRQI